MTLVEGVARQVAWQLGDRSMKLLFVIDSLGASGTEHSTAALLPVLRDRGHEVSVATMYDAGFGDEERIRADGFDVRPLRSEHYVGRVRELRRRIRASTPDVVHCALFRSDMVGRVAGWRTGAVVVSSLVNTPYDPARPQLGDVSPWKLRSVQAADAATARLVDHFHAVSQGVAEANVRALHLRPERITVVERGRARAGPRDLERRSGVSASERTWASPDAEVVLAVGRQEHQKRHVDLIAAADAMVDRVAALAGPHRRAARQRDAGAAAGPRRPPACRGGHHVARPPSRRPRPAVRRRRARHPVALRGHRGSRHRGDGAALPRRVHRRRRCSRHPEPTGSMPCWSRPVSRRCLADGLFRALHDEQLADALRCRGLADFEERFTIEAAATRMEALYAALTRRPPVEERGGEAAGADARVAPRRGGLIEAHRWAAARPRLPPRSVTRRRSPGSSTDCRRGTRP